MKKIIFALSMLLLIPATSLAWDDCSFGETDCPDPGECSRYVDTDNDGICDHSQSAPEDRESDVVNLAKEEAIVIEEDIHDLITGVELKEKIVSEVAEIYEIDANKYAEALSGYYKSTVKITNSFQFLYDNYGLEPNVAKDIALSIKTDQQTAVPETSSKQKKVTYHLIPISLFLIFLYIIGYILTKKKILSVMTHRKIWNVILLITFLVSGVLGVLLIVRINLGTVIPLPFNILFWHVEVGIAMFVICIFHIIERRQYFFSLFKFKK